MIFEKRRPLLIQQEWSLKIRLSTYSFWGLCCVSISFIYQAFLVGFGSKISGRFLPDTAISPNIPFLTTRVSA